MVSDSQSPLRTASSTLGYKDIAIIKNLNLSITDRSFTVIVGPNACGKSTLLRSLARLLDPLGGEILLDGKDISQLPTKLVAKRLGLLPQSSTSPEGITVRDLVARGRFPHQRMLRQWSAEDDTVIEQALSATGVSELAHRRMDTLSGGQQQRVWISLVLAQQTSLLLLDEPTTFLDITHQLEVLNLCKKLHASGNYTLIAVLHDLNLAFRYATHLIVMKDGGIVAEGSPETIVTADLIEKVYDIGCLIIPDPLTNRPMVVPKP